MESDNRFDELIKKALANDAEAYELLLKLLLKELERLCAKWISDHAEREDLVQDIVLAIHLSRASYNPNLPFRPWVYAIAKRRAIDYHRKKLRRGTLLKMSENIGGTTALSATISSDILSSLSEREKEIFKRIFFTNEAQNVVAEAYAMSLGTLRVALHRIREKVKRVIRES